MRALPISSAALLAACAAAENSLMHTRLPHNNELNRFGPQKPSEKQQVLPCEAHGCSLDLRALQQDSPGDSRNPRNREIPLPRSNICPTLTIIAAPETIELLRVPTCNTMANTPKATDASTPDEVSSASSTMPSTLAPKAFRFTSVDNIVTLCHSIDCKRTTRFRSSLEIYEPFDMQDVCANDNFPWESQSYMVARWDLKAEQQTGGRPWPLKAQSWSSSKDSSVLLPENHRATLKSIFCSSSIRCEKDADIQQIVGEAKSVFDAVVAPHYPVHSSGWCGTRMVADMVDLYARKQAFI
ncbi:hypothetical protein Slin15195_G078010 [Septoria linicola]|uniref:Uncharacterized protein n=1 Tax=Septoria linicola TaxID=215465 RepID=A0A9Q9ELK1_9PEZI|nr:hypothetical protein Slin15195_G078010 [Septoria linicola]